MNGDDLGEALWRAAHSARPDDKGLDLSRISGDGAHDTAWALSAATTLDIALPEELVTLIPAAMSLWSDFEQREVAHDLAAYRKKFPAQQANDL